MSSAKRRAAATLLLLLLCCSTDTVRHTRSFLFGAADVRVLSACVYVFLSALHPVHRSLAAFDPDTLPKHVFVRTFLSWGNTVLKFEYF